MLTSLVQAKTYNQAIDILRVMSILAVVLVHTSTKTLETTNLDIRQLPWSLFLNQMCRFAVPLFFMISSFVLELNYHEELNYGQYLKKRFSRILMPYILWSAIYYLLVYRQHSQGFFYALLSGNASYQLYFIPTLLIFYLIFPLLHRWQKIVGDKKILIILGIIQMELLFYDYQIKPLDFFYPINICLLNYFSFTIGMVACHHEDRLISWVKKWKYVLATATLVLGGLVFYQGGSRFLTTGNYLAFFSQWRISVLIYSLIFAATLFYFLSQIQRHWPIVKKLSRLSFLVFFVHVIWIEIGWNFVFSRLFEMRNNLWGEIFWFDLVFFGAITAVSFGTAYLIQKIPVVRKISG